jgi:hypothetical protein
MQVPSASFIELANDQLPTVSPDHLEAQTRELREAMGDVSPDFANGYELGLQTARVCIETNGELQESDIKADNLL